MDILSSKIAMLRGASKYIPFSPETKAFLYKGQNFSGHYRGVRVSTDREYPNISRVDGAFCRVLQATVGWIRVVVGSIDPHIKGGVLEISAQVQVKK